MRTTKPVRLGLLARPYTHRGEHWLGVACLMHYHLGAPDVLGTEMRLWAVVAEQLRPGSVLDAGIPKLGAEVLVGNAHAYPPSAGATTCPVRVRAGRIEKSLHVVGDRTWQREVPTAPAPLERLALTWERAFGGPGYAENPVGRGFGERARDGAPLPNVELPSHMVRSPADRPPPASFEVLDQTWPQRLRLGGTYDAAWLENDYPGFPSDIDWAYFNLGSSDQWSRDGFGEEPQIELLNLHPTQSLIQSRFPRAVARCVVQRAGHDFEDVALRPTTLWLFPETLEATLIHHGALRISEDDARDVEHLILGADAPDALRPIAHFVDVMRARTDRSARATTAILDDAPLLPPGHSGLSPDLDAAMREHEPSERPRERMWKRIQRDNAALRAEFASHGMDPEIHGPPVVGPPTPRPTLADALAQLEPHAAGVGGLEARIQSAQDEGNEEAREFYREMGVDPAMHDDAMRGSGCGPPRISAREEQAELEAMADDVRAANMDPTFLYEVGSPEKLREQERAARDAYLAGAHLQRPVEDPGEDVRRARREAFVRRLAAGESVRELDFTWADLRGLDLRGRDLQGAWLENADLSEADLTGADLGQAVLARATLERARLGTAKLVGANLGRATLRRVDLSGADLTRANLEEALLEQCTLVGARLLEARTRKVSLSGSDLSRAQLTKLTLLDAQVRGCRFDEAELEEVTLMGASFRDTSLRGARLSRAVVHGVDADGADLTGAQLVRATFVMGCSLRGAVLAKADLRQTLLRTVAMTGADLSGAIADQADFSEADLSSAKLEGLRARGANFTRTDLRGAVLRGADLMEAMLNKADLRGTDLRDANLFGADLALMRSDEATTIEGAYTTRVRARPQRRVS